MKDLLSLVIKTLTLAFGDFLFSFHPGLPPQMPRLVLQPILVLVAIRSLPR